MCGRAHHELAGIIFQQDHPSCTTFHLFRAMTMIWNPMNILSVMKLGGELPPLWNKLLLKGLRKWRILLDFDDQGAFAQ